MVKYQPVAKIRYQSDSILNYSVPSKSSLPGESHRVRFMADGGRECSCIGNSFIEKKGDDMFRDCRHKKLVTIYVHSDDSYLEYLHDDALEHIKNKNRATETAWAIMMCQNPAWYSPTNLHCRGCKLYPDICNIHKIRIKRNKLPLVWKLQGQIYSGERTAAAKTLRQIIKAVEERLHG